MTSQMLKLGKKEAKRDQRNFKMSALLTKAAADVPASYNFDNKHRNIPVPMFGNDQYGDCVIAGRAHQTLRFEHLEQGGILPITDKEVIDEYFRESGGQDTGLYILDSLNEWRKQGWTAAGKNYKIKAFAEVNPADLLEVKRTIWSDIGIMTGFALPDTFWDEFNKGKAWSKTTMPPNPYNGHCVLITGYTKTYLTCITWARRQRMTWKFFTKYCDEAYGIIDASNAGNVNGPVLEKLLNGI